MPPGRVAHRKLSDYCGIFAEKTNRIGRNVESFMQSRGLLPIRRSVDETPRRDVLGVNGDVIRNDPPPRADGETRSENPYHRQHENRDYERPRRNGQKKRVAYSNSTYPRDPTRADASYVRRFNEIEPRRARRREYAVTDYDAADTWRQELDLARGGPCVSKPILRNGINHGVDERPYYSTLPRRSKTINFKDQAAGSPEGGRWRAYPKSLQDLTDLELDDVAYLPFAHGGDGTREERLDDNYRRRNRYRPEKEEEDESPFDDDYLRLCRSLSRLDRYPRGGRYGPGEVHYERECRTFGKDTVAFIYYKTCYL
ncbi:PREDICTED: uncharacterized protein LOC105563401 [Vollenhovia emeryi]|uniref:uncharacterized protein LOC105563401 n=1 Tax=Vollenhovia emeryi TaxID=411798 RepID=UPI0005F57CD7|nr:PREDICTED: uncharacterized protein LOC105563401 [Vollenhovia emeryi]